jgi:hypothetical protein
MLWFSGDIHEFFIEKAIVAIGVAISVAKVLNEVLQFLLCFLLVKHCNLSGHFLSPPLSKGSPSVKTA